MRRNGLHMYALGVAILLAVAPPVAAALFGASCAGGSAIRLAAPTVKPKATVGLTASVCGGKAGTIPSATPERSYWAAKRSVARRLKRLSRRYRTAGAGAQERGSVIRQARGLLVSGLRRHLMPHWCGTPWAYHGTSQVPGRGRIACGYFVSTLLRDMGLRVQRVAMARRPSEAIIKSLVSERHMKRFSDVPIGRFVDRVEKMGSGLYIVGLDNHVGFILVAGGRSSFVHSTYLKPTCVTAENAVTSPALIASRYRVVGKISGDSELLRKWLMGERIATR